MALFDMFGQIPGTSDQLVRDIQAARMAPAGLTNINVGDVGSNPQVGEVGSNPYVGEVGPSNIAPPMPARLVEPNRTAQAAPLPVPPKTTDARLPVLSGEVLPPVGRPTLAPPSQDVSLPMTQDRAMKMDLGRALLAGGSSAQRVQGLQLLAEASRPTSEESKVIERQRLLNVVDSASVDPETKARARVGVQMDAPAKDILEVLGFDAQGRKADLAKREAVTKVLMSYAGETQSIGLMNREQARIQKLQADYPQTTTGLTGWASSYVPNSPMWQINDHLKTFISHMWADQLQRMREASKTGGAVGQVTEKEGQWLQSMQGSLDARLPPSVLQNNMTQIIEGKKIFRQMSVLVPALQAGDMGAMKDYLALNDQLTEMYTKVADMASHQAGLRPDINARYGIK